MSLLSDIAEVKQAIVTFREAESLLRDMAEVPVVVDGEKMTALAEGKRMLTEVIQHRDALKDVIAGFEHPSMSDADKAALEQRAKDHAAEIAQLIAGAKAILAAEAPIAEKAIAKAEKAGK